MHTSLHISIGSVNKQQKTVFHLVMSNMQYTYLLKLTFRLSLQHRFSGFADLQGVKNLVFGGPSRDKNFKKLRVMNSLEIRSH